jgi:hypothetical protein
MDTCRWIVDVVLRPNGSKNLFEKSAQSFVYRGFDEIEPFCSKSIPVKGYKILFKQVLRVLFFSLSVGLLSGLTVGFTGKARGAK